jgi:hypothetical protein
MKGGQSMSFLVNIVKIDLCGSKVFASNLERKDPSIRKRALNKLIEISQRAFPYSDKEYPNGSFYKADGDAVIYILEKPSVALRSAIEFMQLWFHKGMPDYPDCRVFLDHGHVELVEVPGKTELTGKVFENISLFEKGQDSGQIFLTKNLLDELDITMAKFRHLTDIEPRTGERLSVFRVDFDDPRTFEDSSLIHALFVAHPSAEKARDRLFELFAVEYLLGNEELKNIETLIDWAKNKGYPLPSPDQMDRVLQNSELFESTKGAYLRIKPEAAKDVERARSEFIKAQNECIETISNEIIVKTEQSDALEGIKMEQLIEDYLCVVFSEVRMMANYFRETLHMFDTGPEQFARFDYVIQRRLDKQRQSYFQSWRDGFVNGIRISANQDNIYIAAVFHNVLATYYLNRSGKTSPYQIKRLRDRQVFVDTNVLYSMMVAASRFHGITTYFSERLATIGVLLRVFPFTLREYEEALSFVESNYTAQGPSEVIVRRNPWLLQEFMNDPMRYLNNIAVCRSRHSICSDIEIKSENHSTLKMCLEKLKLILVEEYDSMGSEEAEESWLEHRNMMTDNKWDIEKYWDFIYKEIPVSVKIHDMTCIRNLIDYSKEAGKDALGKKVLFITVDGKLLRLRRKYPFIVSPQQFLEFILPYLFLSDVPVSEAERFPNRLLASQLGTLLVKRPPGLTEMIAVYFRNPDLIDQDVRSVFRDVTESDARALSEDRFRSIVKRTASLSEEQRAEVAFQTAAYYDELFRTQQSVREAATEYKELRKNAEIQIEELRKELEIKKKKEDKLQKTIRYLKSQKAKSK